MSRNIIDKLPRDIQLEVERIGFHRDELLFDMKSLKRIRNCGSFLKRTVPYTPAKLNTASQELRKAFRQAVIRSLYQFKKRVDKLKLFNYACIHEDASYYWTPGEVDFLKYRIEDAIDEVQTNPDMKGEKLAKRCRRIVEWKRNSGKCQVKHGK